MLDGDFLTQGPAVEVFEQALAKRVGVKHVVAVSSGTAALHIACLAAGLGAKDAALTSTLTFVATANAPRYCGARADLLDIDPVSLGLDPQGVAAHLKSAPDTKVILPVSFAGLSVDMAALRQIAGDRVIIEDACHALGGAHEDGAPVGSCAYADMTVFSFHPVKPITTAEGGAITTNDDEFARRLRLLRSHGIERDPKRFIRLDGVNPDPWAYEQQELGYNYRLSDLQAALGISQMARLDGFIDRRRNIAAYYDQAFENLGHVALPHSAPEERARSGLHLYVLRVDFAALGKTRGEVMAALKQKGIGTQVHYIPVHMHPYHAQKTDAASQKMVNAMAFYEQALSIPLFPSMTDGEVEYVANTISGLLR